MKRISLLCGLLFFGLVSWAQSLIIKGQVLDAGTNQGLPNCTVYINNTTVGATADLDGRFTLAYTPQLDFELVFSYVGYQSQTKKITQKAGELPPFTIALVASDVQLTEVQVKAKKDKKWEKQLKYFKNAFFGFSDFAEKCTIENAWVLDFDDTQTEFKANASQPIKVLNQALGYILQFDLKEFSISEKGSKIKANVQFSEGQPKDKREVEEWLKNRALAYKKSQNYFYKSLIDRTHTDKGFMLYVEKTGGNINTFRSDNFKAEIGKSVLLYEGKDMIGHGPKPEVSKIFIKNNLEVHHHAIRSDLKTYRDTPYAISWLQTKRGFLYVNAQGIPLNPEEVVASGDMDYLKVSGLLPLNYDPLHTANEAYFLQFERPLFTEQVHLHTDRQVYYPSSTVWVKAYMNYENKLPQDTASSVLYVQWLSPEKKVIDTHKFEIKDGIAYGQFTLPESQPNGVYLIRAFTQYMRNFDNAHFFYQAVPVLANTDLITSIDTLSSPANGLLKINIESTWRDKNLDLNLKVTNKEGLPLSANLSVAVGNPKFLPHLGLGNISEKKVSGLKKTADLKYELEKGLKVEGIRLDKNKNPISGEFQFFVNDIQSIQQGKSNESGVFVLDNLSFYDNTPFYFQQDSKKNKGSVFLIKDDFQSPELSILPTIPQYSILKNETPLFLDVVSNVEVVDTSKITQTRKVKTLYGRPDYVVTSDDISKVAGNAGVLNGLRAKVPGINITNTGMNFRVGTASVFNSSEPFVLLDGVPYGVSGGSAIQILSSIDPTTIDRIEVVTRMSNMYGDFGKNGIISVFSKDEQKSSPFLDNKNITKMVMMGFVKPRFFERTSFQMTQKENVPVLYWNPEVLTDLTGQSKLTIENIDFKEKIVVEIHGITANNQRFSYRQYINPEK
jgi:CarboxypepD_reg-like domain/TonB-dependent Receptor Plug Domain/MG2 domain